MTRAEAIKQFDLYINQIPSYRLSEFGYDIRETVDDMGYFDAPASTKYHGAYEGGLAEHSLRVTERLIELTKHNNLVWEEEASTIIVGLFHDLCKCDSYIINGNEYDFTGKLKDKIEHRKDQLLTGHGEKSVMIASTLIKLSLEEVMCIRYHMYMFEKDIDSNIIGRVVRHYPNVLFTHVADMLVTAEGV